MTESAQTPIVDDAPQKQLSDEDMARVAEYLNSPLHRLERKPFRPWLLLGFLMALVTGLSLLSLLYAEIHGIPLW